jgi:hypothetical protein
VGTGTVDGAQGHGGEVRGEVEGAGRAQRVTSVLSVTR